MMEGYTILSLLLCISVASSISNNDINDCSPDPCENGGTCSDGVNTFTCACDPGYTGPTCETAILNEPGPLGLESYVIPDSSMTASSEYNADHGAERGRLNLARDGNLRGAWCSRARNVNQWIQVDLLHLYRITSVATQGREDTSQWVTSYKLACSTDGTNFHTVQGISTNPGADRIFTGNVDSNTIVTNTLPVPQMCRYVRLMPVSWFVSISLRMEIYGEGPFTGEAITCKQCSAVYSTNDEALNIPYIIRSSCTEPRPTDCGGNASCVTIISLFNFWHETEGLIVLTTMDRGCNPAQYSQLIPAGDVCLDDATVAIIKADSPDPLTSLPSHLRPMYLNSSLSFCVCDSEDLCTPPSPVAPTPPSPVVPMTEPAPDTDDCTPNPCLNGGGCTDGVNNFTCACAAGYEGNTCDTGEAITCKQCSAVYSTNDEALNIPYIIRSSCTEPRPTDCGGNASCVTIISLFNFWHETEGLIVLTTMDRGCNPAQYSQLIPAGDVCLDDATVAIIKADSPDPLTSLPSHLRPMYLNSSLSFCVCDSEDLCTPPSPVAPTPPSPVVPMTEPAPDTDDCTPNPCLNGGGCTDGVNNFTCACAAGYEGNTCDTGEAITCNECLAVYSTNDEALNISYLVRSSCTEPTPTDCGGNASCVTMIRLLNFWHETEGLIVITTMERGCDPAQYSQLIPAGDVCLDDATVAIIKADLPDPSTRLPPHLRPMYLNSSLSVCVCNSEDLCTPPSPVAPTPSSPVVPMTEPAPGEAITCKECFAVYSTNDGALNIPYIVRSSCTEPRPTDCGGNASCVTIISLFNFWHETEGLIVLTTMDRGCNPAQYSQLIPAGDVCLDDATVAIIKADLPDPLTSLPPHLRPMYLNSSLSFCVCDSEDLCTPPSPVAPTPPSPVVPMTEPAPDTDDCTPNPCLNGGGCTDGVNNFTCTCADGYEGNTCDTGEAITCNECLAVYSTNDEALNISYLVRSSCTEPTPRDCGGNASCVTMIRLLNFWHETEGLIVITTMERGCDPAQYSQLIPAGDVCLDDATVAIIKADLPDPSTRLPPHLRPMYLNSSLSVCVCNSEDLCTPPLPVAPTPPSPVVPMTEPAPDTDDCTPNPCLNGGGCTDGVNNFTCACAAGYEGNTCDTDINDCSPDPCENGGICSDGVNTFTCACDPGYTGPTCGTVSHSTGSSSGAELRLAGSGSSANQGRVEVYANRQWGTVCGDLWGQNDANVVCRQLGFPGAYGYTNAQTFGAGSGPILMDNTRCVGNETSIMDCPKNAMGVHNCQHSDDVGVICRVAQGISRGAEVRLAGSGSSANQGRVEVYINEQWGTVCDNLWGINDADVVCRQLGFPGASRATRDAKTFGAGSGPILLDRVKCVGDETSILDCMKSAIGVHNCLHSDDAGVICDIVSNSTGSSSGAEVRLAGSGSSANQGRVEVYINGQWGTVCDDFWGQEDANVVCRQLDFPGAYGYTNAQTFGAGSGPILMDNTRCVGNETSIMDCPKNAMGVHNCQHSDDVGVICRVAQGISRGAEVRLAGSGSSANQGRVEVYINEQWGTVCDNLWGINDADVVCRQLGFPGASRATRDAKTFGAGSGPILLDRVRCVGDETSILDCMKSAIGFHNCLHSDDAGVICDIAERRSMGELELYHNIEEQVAAEERSNAKKDADLKKKNVLQALSDFLAKLKDK
ncbi:uncharacterized protein LOC763130 isoform X3 [Strongylocentrotus purpuratus]|uniref:Uncharacterized protein n=1 Tax=Strongylocentrotus purpuratus TaxID=7668 RepID=A0A7M7P299_STRPU|nr:uncharacterized protein LOC763130 isoform X3 [Strongylocentrotus purpuratus]